MTILVQLIDGPCRGYYKAAFDEPPEHLQAVFGPDEDAMAILDEPGDQVLLGETARTYERTNISFACKCTGAGKGCRITHIYTMLDGSDPAQLELVSPE